MTFKVGDKVKITRKATNNENGWENLWVPAMDVAVGKTGTVVRLCSGKYDIDLEVPEVKDLFGYPSFVLELVPKFKVGDRVNVKWYGDSYWEGPATVKTIYDYTRDISVLTDSGHRSVFGPEDLTLIEAPKQEPVPVKPEPSLGGFKVGDRVRIKASRGTNYAMIPAAVISFDSEYLRIKAKGIRRIGTFRPENIEHLTEGKAVKLTSPVFQVARELAVKIAKESVGWYINADQVQAELIKLGYTSADLGNAAGVLFRGKNWRKTGVTKKSERKGSHSREISVWQYTGV